MHMFLCHSQSSCFESHCSFSKYRLHGMTVPGAMQVPTVLSHKQPEPSCRHGSSSLKRSQGTDCSVRWHENAPGDHEQWECSMHEPSS